MLLTYSEIEFFLSYDCCFCSQLVRNFCIWLCSCLLKPFRFDLINEVKQLWYVGKQSILGEGVSLFDN